MTCPAASSGSIYRMSTHDSYDTIGAILDIHAMIHGFLIEAVEGIPESRMAEQPGSLVNHPAWTLSHLNAYAGVLLSMLDDPSVPADYRRGVVRAMVSRALESAAP